jgi:hypothetical protein
MTNTNTQTEEQGQGHTSDHPIPGQVLTEGDIAAGWKLHDGGPNPVPGEMVDFTYANGSFSRNSPSEAVHWEHRGWFRLSRPQPEPSAPLNVSEGAEAAVERKAFDPQFYAELRKHALTALRYRRLFTINADGALAIIDQAAADRASHEALFAQIKARDERIAALEEGLRPFGELEANYHPDTSDGLPLHVRVTLGLIRRARTLTQGGQS